MATENNDLTEKDFINAIKLLGVILLINIAETILEDIHN